MAIVSILFAYLLGSVPWGFLLTKWRLGGDIRKMGSGNMGAANVWRQGGRGLGLAVLLLDAGKGTLAVWLTGNWSGESMDWMSAAALAAMLGHVFPVWLKFKGGKAVATFFGCFAWLAPLPALAVTIVWLGGTILTRHTSVGSCLAVGTFPMALWLILHPPAALLMASAASAALILWRHKENFVRIRAGTEVRIRFGSR
ncbi:MAG: glycerol-3-phosphate 1-O-acyltransferase PlsY [Acidimicrobiia bacterium]|nr:glycerol-3-phosphate 1-O-acyltransferase PlsY [Acidimicrobiia bacterium]